MDIEQIKELLERYQQGQCTSGEVLLIEEWLAGIKNEGLAQLNDDLIDKQLQIIRSRIEGKIQIQPVTVKRNDMGWLKIAASVLIIASCAIGIRALYLKRSLRKELAAQPSTAQHISKGWVYVETGKAARNSIKLPDGSQVTLNASSRLRYPVKFMDHRRPVFLDEGEALFEVAKDKSSPFTVYTNKFVTTALGTAFNIRSYASEHKVSISLIHGKIRVDDLHPALKTNNSKILLPHQQIVLNKISGRVIKSDFKDEIPITSWKDGVLSFQDATMDEVVNSIENRFNVVIQNHSAHTNWSYTGTFKQESLNDVLKIVCMTEGLTYTIDNNKIALN